MEQTLFVANPTRLLIAAVVGIIILLLLIRPLKKFIVGEPINEATNLLLG